jgi:hypothetical protein
MYNITVMHKRICPSYLKGDLNFLLIVYFSTMNKLEEPTLTNEEYYIESMGQTQKLGQVQEGQNKCLAGEQYLDVEELKAFVLHSSFHQVIHL